MTTPTPSALEALKRAAHAMDSAVPTGRLTLADWFHAKREVAAAIAAAEAAEPSEEFERGRRQGMQQERALWQLAQSSAELERTADSAAQVSGDDERAAFEEWWAKQPAAEIYGDLQDLDSDAGSVGRQAKFMARQAWQARAALTPPPAPAAQATYRRVGHVRIDSGELHLFPAERDPDAAGLVDGQPVFAVAATPEVKESLTPPAEIVEPWTAKQKGLIAGDGFACPNDHDPDCRWPDCNCRHRQTLLAAPAEGSGHPHRPTRRDGAGLPVAASMRIR